MTIEKYNTNQQVNKISLGPKKWSWGYLYGPEDEGNKFFSQVLSLIETGMGGKVDSNIVPM